MKETKKAGLAALLLALLWLLCGCASNPNEDKLYAKLLAAFEQGGYPAALADVAEDTPVGVYNASVWKQLLLANGEAVLVYFDESNRADYLVTLVDEDAYGYATFFGQRFVLVYPGADEGLLSFLQTLA